MALIDQDVEAVANAHATAMAPPTRKAMVRLRKALNTIESARLAKPSDAVLNALEWIKQLVANWALRVVLNTQEAAPKGRIWDKASAQEWFKGVARKHGPTLSSTDIKQLIKEDGGPAWGTVQKTSFYKAYMALRQRAKAERKTGPSGKRVGLDHAESELATNYGLEDLDDVDDLEQKQQAEFAEENRPRRSHPKG